MDARGQATVEWTGLLLVACLAFGALVALAPRVDGRPFGGFLAHRIVCAAKGSCRDGDRLLARVYGREDAALVRRLAPSLVYEPGEAQLPVDWRRCRARSCADAPDDRDLDAHRSHAGERATVFTRLQRRDGRTYVSYFLYYPDSNTTLAGSDKVWEASWLLPKLRQVVAGSSDYPGFHRDDWESVEVRLDADGRAWIRASAHGGYDTCKGGCGREWIEHAGWTRVSRGSHAGHIPVAGRSIRPRLPGLDLRERTSTADGLRLIPLEGIDHDRYRPLDDDVPPPWRKEVYDDPTSDKS
jgi:hypothetical protein